MEGASFRSVAQLCETLASTASRNDKIQLIAEFLKYLDLGDVSFATMLIVGWRFPSSPSEPLAISYAALSEVIDDSRSTTLSSDRLTIGSVANYLNKISQAEGVGSRKRKLEILRALFSKTSTVESKWLVKNIFGEMQHGVSEGIMMEAIAAASGAGLDLVRRANMFINDLGAVAEIALGQGPEGLSRVSISLFRPVKPMLAEMSYDIEEVIEEHGGCTSLEYKLDGARVQIHKSGEKVRIFSRRLNDVTRSLPDVVELVREGLRAKVAIVDGEVIGLGKDDKPLVFQDLMRRFRRIRSVENARRDIRIRLKVFDILYVDGRTLVDEPYENRWEVLQETLDHDLLVERMITSDPKGANDFMKRSLESGHEGLMAKALKSTYIPGMRGKRWFKIKPSDSLDLVIVSAEWGYGRRTGWLSDYHLAAFDPNSGSFEEVGKTFKGLTDEEFREMTQKLLKLKIRESQTLVEVRPSIVVEVAFNEVQRSPKYKSGYALRFARITRIRDDKLPTEADTLKNVETIYRRNFERKDTLFFASP